MEQKGRIRFLQEKIVEQRLGAVLLFYSRDVFYYTGTAQPSYLFVSPEEYILFVRRGLEFALDEVFIERDKIKEEGKLANIYREICAKIKKKKIGTEMDVLPATQMQEYQEVFSDFEFVNVSPLILEQRQTKDASEVHKLKKACEVMDAGHKAALLTLKEGITELELAAAVENAHRLAGHEGTFFIRQPDFFMSTGPIASGPNLYKISGAVYTITGVGLSALVPAGPSRRPISKGDLIIIDVPTLVNGYHADQTRTYILGKAPQKVKTLYGKLKEIADYLIGEITPGMTCSQIYQMAIGKSKELKIADAFLNFGKGRKSRMIGHGIGLELNEPPILSTYNNSQISDGFVLALDMHMMDENVGVVKLEDMILVTNNGNQILTKSPRDLFEI